MCTCIRYIYRTRTKLCVRASQRNIMYSQRRIHARIHDFTYEKSHNLLSACEYHSEE